MCNLRPRLNDDLSSEESFWGFPKSKPGECSSICRKIPNVLFFWEIHRGFISLERLRDFGCIQDTVIMFSYERFRDSGCIQDTSLCFFLRPKIHKICVECLFSSVEQKYMHFIKNQQSWESSIEFNQYGFNQFIDFEILEFN